MTQQKLRVWWIPQVPGKFFHVEVANLVEAKVLLEALADYDLFQYKNCIKGDYCNAGGLQVWDTDGETWGWYDWYDDESGKGIDDYTLDKLRQLSQAKVS